MVSLADAQSPCSPSSRIQRSHGRSMRTIRSTLFSAAAAACGGGGGGGDHLTSPSAVNSPRVSENLTDSAVDVRLTQLAAAMAESSASKSASMDITTDLLELSRGFSDFSSFNSDISGELQRLALVRDTDSPRRDHTSSLDLDEIDDVESMSLELVDPVIRSCVETLLEPSAAADAKSAAAARIRVLAKHRSDFRALIGDLGAIEALIPYLRSEDPVIQENSVTALLNLSLEESNKAPITAAGAIKPLVYALRTGTATAKQNAACALLSLSMIEDNRITIGVLGAVPPLVSLLVNGSSRGKKDALTTLYKLCSVKQNKDRAVRAGAVGPLIGLVGEHGNGIAEKAMVVLSSLAAIQEGRAAIVEEGGIQVLVEAIEDGPTKGKEFAVVTLLLLCSESVRNRGLLVREGAIPPLVALSQSGSARAKHKAETLLGYLREQRQDGPSSGIARLNAVEDGIRHWWQEDHLLVEEKIGRAGSRGAKDLDFPVCRQEQWRNWRSYFS